MTLESGIRSFDAKAEARRFMLFVALGGCAAAANWLSRFPLEYFMSFSAAVVVAYMVGMVIAFTLFNRYVFPASPRPLPSRSSSSCWSTSPAMITSLDRVHGSGLSCISGHWICRSRSPSRLRMASRIGKSDDIQLLRTQFLTFSQLIDAAR